MDGVGVAAIITDVPWGDEKNTGYNTTVDWGAALRAISTVFDMNAGLPMESKQQGLENVAGVQTLTNFFCGNVLGPLSISALESLEMVLEKNVKEFGRQESWPKKKIDEMVQTLCEKAKERFSDYAEPFQALHSSGTFKHNCLVTGCAALKGKCNEDGKTLVVGQKSVELGEFLVERYTSAAGQVVMDPFMGSCSAGIAALRKGRCFLGYEQKQSNFFSAVFHLSCALNKMIEGDDVYVLFNCLLHRQPRPRVLVQASVSPEIYLVSTESW